MEEAGAGLGWEHPLEFSGIKVPEPLWRLQGGEISKMPGEGVVAATREASQQRGAWATPPGAVSSPKTIKVGKDLQDKNWG